MNKHFPEMQEKILADDPLDPKTVLTLFISTVIVVLYLVSLMLIIIRRARKLIELQNRRYYLMIAFYILTKLIICTIIVIQVIVDFANSDQDIKSESLELYIKTGIVLADYSLIELFFINLQNYFYLCLSTLKDGLSKKLSKLITHGLKAVQIVTTLVVLIPLVLLDVDELSFNILNGIELGINMLSMILFLVTFFFLTFRMTGIMMEQRLNEVLKRVLKLQMIILVSRFVMITFQILISLFVHQSFQAKIAELSENIRKEVVLALLFIGAILFMLLTEGLPIMYSLRSSVVQSLNFTAFTAEHKQSIFTSKSNTLEDSLVQKGSDQSNKQETQNRAVKLSDFKDLKELMPDKEDAIWLRKTGNLEGINYLIRVSKHQISSYILEDIQNEFSLWHYLKIPTLTRMSYFCEGEIIHLVEKYYKTSLDLKVDETQGPTELLKLAIKVGEAINICHEQDVIHGSLTPNHIFFENNQIILNGCGLHSMRKYLSLITGYTNKSMYTAVQNLRDKNNVTLKPKKTADVYSFGVILYEIVTKNRQYRQLGLREVIAKFAEEDFRPKLPEQTKVQVKNLIRRCWHQNPERRPQIEEVLDHLRRLT